MKMKRVATVAIVLKEYKSFEIINYRILFRIKNNMEIPFFKPSLPPLPAYTKNLEHIWETKMISNFSFYSSKMEQIIASYLNIDPEHVIVISSADTGLLISISILNIPQNSEIILPSFTFNSTANVVVWNRMIPVFADINKQTLNMDPIDVKKKITGKTKAILATHVFGNPCDINSLRKIAKENNCYLLFDAAHAYGAKYRKNKVGSLADIEVFSFSGTKLATSAEGGVIVTRNKILAQRARMARNFGFTDDYNSQILGLNGKISEFNAALGYLTLPHIDSYVEKRNKVASIYRSELHDVG